MKTRKFSAFFDIKGGVGSTFKKAFGSSEKAIDGLSRSIRKLEKERRTVGKNIRELQKAGKATANLSRYSERLGEKIDSLRRKQERYNKALAFGSKAQGAGRGLIRGGLAAAAGLGASVLGASGVQDSEIRLSTVLNAKDKDKALADARKTARQIGLSGLMGLSEAYDSQYALNSANIEAQAARFGTGVVAKVSKITKGGAESVSEVIATAYNNLGGQIGGSFEDRFTRIGDLLTKVQLKFQIRDFDQLGESLKKGAAILSTYQIEVSQGVAALGELNSAGLQGSLAGTGLAAVMRNLGKASNELGYEVKRNAKGNLDLAQTLQGLRDSVQDMDTDERAAVLQRLFGDEGLPAITALLRDVEGLTEKFAEVATDSVGLMDREIARFSKSSTVHFQKFKNSVVIIADLFGRVLLPPVNSVLSVLARGTGALAEWSERHPFLTKAIGGTAATVTMLSLGIGGLLLGVGKLMSWLPLMQAGFGGIKFVLGILGRAVLPLVLTGVRAIGAALIANPIGAIIMGIATAAFLVWKYWEPIKGFFATIWDGAKKAFAAYYDYIKRQIAKLGAIISKVRSFFGFGGDEEGEGGAKPAGAPELQRAVDAANQTYHNSTAKTVQNSIKIETREGQSASEIADEVLWRLGQQEEQAAGGALYDY